MDGTGRRGTSRDGAVACRICRHGEDGEPGLLRLPLGEEHVIAPLAHAGSLSALPPEQRDALLATVDRALGDGQALRLGRIDGHLALHAAGRPLLVPGGREAPLLPRLGEELDRAAQVDIAVSFAMLSGVRRLRPWLEELLERGGRIRIVIGDYLNVTEPEAIAELLDLAEAGHAGTLELHILESDNDLPFHAKGWVFRGTQGPGRAVIGSSNLSRSALEAAIEWNLVTEPMSPAWREAAEAFEALLARSETRRLDRTWLEDYRARRRTRPPVPAGETPTTPPEPHALQKEALEALCRARREGAAAGLVVMATGLGKT